MPHTVRRSSAPTGGRQKFIEAAFALIRAQGYASTTVDQLCAEAGLTKGAFFHYFKSKEALAVAAAQAWREMSDALFASAAYHRHEDPLDRVLGYIDFRKSLIVGTVTEFSCLAGTMAQETYQSCPAIRKACEACLAGHAADIEAEIADAMKFHKPRVKCSARSVALHIQAVLQGAFILAKATGDTVVAKDSVDHVRRYVELLFTPRHASASSAPKRGGTRKS
jgi:TetR/AcrR family transcriptional regulator, transcriptional repressor for nem operon